MIVATARPGRTRTLALAASALCLVLGATACGGSDSSADEKKSATPSPTVDLGLASGQELTKTGSTLTFGDRATVAFEPNDTKATGLKLSVVSVAKGSIRDLAAYSLDAQTRTATPYYATVTVRNVGKTDVGKAAIPLWGLSSDDTLIGASGFTNTFAKCPSGPLPSPFGAGKKTSTCLMYLIPKGATLEGISFRPVASDEPIVWKGTIGSGTPSAKPSGSPSSSSSP